MKKLYNILYLLLIILIFNSTSCINKTKLFDETTNDVKSNTNEYTNDYIANVNYVVGDYILFGSYYNEPILWRIININEEGNLLLFSEKIIMYKAFCAPYSGKMGYFNDGTSSADLDFYDRDRIREAYGANNWRVSSIREWLNSSEEKVTFTYSPTKEAVEDNYYDNEPGFLTNFTDDELNAIQPTVIKTIVNSFDLDSSVGGSKIIDLDFVDDIEIFMESYDERYYQETEDKVFLISLKELYEYVVKNDFPMEKYPTKLAVENYQSDEPYKPSTDNPEVYFTREPDEYLVISPFCIYKTYINTEIPASDGRTGIVPALYVSPEGLGIVEGNGTFDNPYKMSE